MQSMATKQTSSKGFNGLPAGQQVMLKLTPPEQSDFYVDFVRTSPGSC